MSSKCQTVIPPLPAVANPASNKAWSSSSWHRAAGMTVRRTSVPIDQQWIYTATADLESSARLALAGRRSRRIRASQPIGSPGVGRSRLQGLKAQGSGALSGWLRFSRKDDGCRVVHVSASMRGDDDHCDACTGRETPERPTVASHSPTHHLLWLLM